MKDANQNTEFDQRVAEEKGGLIGAAMVNDEFILFRDVVDVGIRGGISAVIKPGGSPNDYQAIEACNESNGILVFTGQRCFKH